MNKTNEPSEMPLTIEQALHEEAKEIYRLESHIDFLYDLAFKIRCELKERKTKLENVLGRA